MRWTPLLLAALAAPALAGPDLPDFGSPADAAMSKDREAQIGRGVMVQLRNAGVVIDDPQLTEYLGSLGSQIASHANNGDFRFNFFFVNENQINAFALPGGYIGVNSGLLLATDNENELAGVLAHEISHVTQRHLARSAYDTQRTSIASMAAMLAALLLGAATDAGGQALEGIAIASQAAMAQRQLNFTRSNEIEADRVGMKVLSEAGFDPNGMGTFFEELSKRYGSTVEFVPAILQTHPVTTERVAEARERARQLPKVEHQDSTGYALAKVRLQVLSAPSPEAAFALFRDKTDSRAPADRYGTALAMMRISLNDNAERIFRELMTESPTTIAYRIGDAEALMAGGSTDAAMAAYAEAVRLFPRNVPLTISYAEALISAGRAAEAHQLLLDLLNNVAATPEQLRLIARAANAQGDIGNAYFYMSYYYTSIGNLPLAIGQVRMALEMPRVNSVDRARYQARMNELLEYLPPEQRNHAAVGGH
ncbi:MAG TPA: M48 family metalloprotease [Gammaproteobacteria bacterium]|jgi:predicted Zn-dependent protease|nr:M48 family metalloprotease [Gammaproteobacteria bacterium]